MRYSTRNYARVESGSRFSQIYVASEERLFMFELWKNGVVMAGGSTASLEELARSLHSWLVSQPNVIDLCSELHFISAREHAEAFEQGREVEWKWQYMQKTIPEYFPELIPFLDEASKNPVLRQLFPFTSLNRFCFSRCTGYPYSGDCPIVTPIGDDLYNVSGSKQQFNDNGNAYEAVQLVLKLLPENCGPARSGTTEDL